MTNETPVDATPEESGDVMFSRGGISALGKCTFVLKTNVPDDTYLGFKKLANQAGCTSSELLRDLVCLVVHNQTFGEITASQRRNLLNGPGPEKDLLQHLFRANKGE